MANLGVDQLLHHRLVSSPLLNGNGEAGTPSREKKLVSQARISWLEQQISTLNRSLEDRDRKLQEARRALRDREGELNWSQKQLSAALEHYRGLLLRGSPQVPQEIVAGDSVYALETSMERAKELVEEIRTRITSPSSGKQSLDVPARNQRPARMPGTFTRLRLALLSSQSGP